MSLHAHLPTLLLPHNRHVAYMQQGQIDGLTTVEFCKHVFDV